MSTHRGSWAIGPPDCGPASQLPRKPPCWPRCTRGTVAGDWCPADHGVAGRGIGSRKLRRESGGLFASLGFVGVPRRGSTSNLRRPQAVFPLSARGTRGDRRRFKEGIRKWISPHHMTRSTDETPTKGPAVWS